nr:S9 family peptidase [Actinomycetales bacterium]
RVVMPTELVVKSADGYPVHGWVFVPEGEGPHPVLLNIHGGPHADYTWGWFDEVQVLAGAGYAVVQCNPRGSAGYGREHGTAIREQMGTLDFQDVIAFLEGALKAEKSLDKKRLGIMGGSYGGYLTAWTIAHDHRFATAVVERGYLDPGTFVGTSDIGWYFSEEYTGADPAHAETQSPMAFVHQVRTPTLVIHSEEDWRCPIEQAQRWFAALRRTGTPTEMLVFPGEDHELSRSGTPWHRRQRFDAVLEWVGRHLPVEA